MDKKEFESKVRETLEALPGMTEERQKQVVNQIVYVDQIEIGEHEELNFVQTETELGLPLVRKGRIEFAKVEEIAPTMCDFLKQSVNPKGDIKLLNKIYSEAGLKKENAAVEKRRSIRARDKPEIIERNKEIYQEVKKLEEAGCKMNKNTRWSIYKIMRGKKRVESFEEDGMDLDLLTLQNSFLSNEDLEEIYELRKELYEE